MTGFVLWTTVRGDFAIGGCCCCSLDSEAFLFLLGERERALLAVLGVRLGPLGLKDLDVVGEDVDGNEVASETDFFTLASLDRRKWGFGCIFL